MDTPHQPSRQRATAKAHERIGTLSKAIFPFL